MLFIDAILELWFRSAEQLRSVHDLFFGTFYNQEMYLESHFLSLTQALESLHRVTMGGKYLSDADWQPHAATLTACIPAPIAADQRQSLKTRILYGNEYSLRKRLQNLLAEMSNRTLDALSINKDQFPGRIVDTRNYLTHLDDSLKEGALQGNALYFACQQLKTILIVLLAKRIGVEESKVVIALQQNRSYKHILALIQEEAAKK